MLYLLPLVLILAFGRFAFQHRWWHMIRERQIIYLLLNLLVILTAGFAFYLKFQPITEQEVVIFAGSLAIGLLAVEIWNGIRWAAPRLQRNIRRNWKVWLIAVFVVVNFFLLKYGGKEGGIVVVIEIMTFAIGLIIVKSTGMRIRLRP